MRIKISYVLIWLAICTVASGYNLLIDETFSVFGALLLSAWALMIIKALSVMFDFSIIKDLIIPLLPNFKWLKNMRLSDKRLEISIRIVNKDNSKITF